MLSKTVEFEAESCPGQVPTGFPLGYSEFESSFSIECPTTRGAYSEYLEIRSTTAWNDRTTKDAHVPDLLALPCSSPSNRLQSTRLQQT